jgi:ketosteroid isomerase-like protein
MAAADVMHRYVEAARSGDFDSAFGMFDDDIVFRVPGRSQFAGEHRGRKAAMAYIDHARGLSRDHDVGVEVIDALTSGERFCLIVRELFHLDGRTIEIRRANVYRVVGEKIVEVWIFEGDQYAADELMSGERAAA